MLCRAVGAECQVITRMGFDALSNSPSVQIVRGGRIWFQPSYCFWKSGEGFGIGLGTTVSGVRSISVLQDRHITFMLGAWGLLLFPRGPFKFRHPGLWRGLRELIRAVRKCEGIVLCSRLGLYVHRPCLSSVRPPWPQGPHGFCRDLAAAHLSGGLSRESGSDACPVHPTLPSFQQLGSLCTS